MRLHSPFPKPLQPQPRPQTLSVVFHFAENPFFTNDKLVKSFIAEDHDSGITVVHDNGGLGGWRGVGNRGGGRDPQVLSAGGTWRRWTNWISVKQGRRGGRGFGRPREGRAWYSRGMPGCFSGQRSPLLRVPASRCITTD